MRKTTALGVAGGLAISGLLCVPAANAEPAARTSHDFGQTVRVSKHLTVKATMKYKREGAGGWNPGKRIARVVVKIRNTDPAHGHYPPTYHDNATWGLKHHPAGGENRGGFPVGAYWEPSGKLKPATTVPVKSNWVVRQSKYPKHFTYTFIVKHHTLKFQQ